MVEKWIRKTLICEALDILLLGLSLLKKGKRWGQWRESLKCVYAFLKKEKEIFKAGNQIIWLVFPQLFFLLNGRFWKTGHENLNVTVYIF